jgi:hypothetical protein
MLTSAESRLPHPIKPPAHFRVSYAVALDSLTALVFLFTAAAVFWRGSNEHTPLLVSSALLTLGVAISPALDALSAHNPNWEIPILIVRFIGFGLLLLVFYVFPDGQYVPRWTRILVLVWAG